MREVEASHTSVVATVGLTVLLWTKNSGEHGAGSSGVLKGELGAGSSGVLKGELGACSSSVLKGDMMVIMVLRLANRYQAKNHPMHNLIVVIKQCRIASSQIHQLNPK